MIPRARLASALGRSLAILATAGPVLVLGGCPHPGADSTAAAVFLAPPPAGQAVQLHVGPFDVPTAGAPYEIPQNECQDVEPTFADFQHPLPATSSGEVQRDYFLKFPSDQDEDVVRVQMRLRPGSHHMNLFKTDSESHPDCVDDTFDQLAFQNYDLFAGTQNTDTDWVLPVGTAIHVGAHEQLVLQTHYVNALEQRTPDKGEVFVNLWFAPPGSHVQHMGTLFATDTAVDIAPRSTASYSLWFTFDHDVHIAAMTGHFHYHGKSFRVARSDGKSEGALVYDSENWAEPPFEIYPDPGLPVASGQGIQLDADYVNDTPYEIKYGPHVEQWPDPHDPSLLHPPQEHCNLFVYFYPADSRRDAIYTTTDASESEAQVSQ